MAFLMSAPIVIDGKGHVAGRLSAAIAKQLLNGKRIVVIRAEDIVTNGDHKFNYHKYRRFLNKTTNTNPRDGPFHQRAPSEMFLRTVRGMCNYKTARGAAAFANLKVFEGVPPKYEHCAKLVVPHALRVISIHRERPTTSLGKIATTFGWKYGNIVKSLEEKRQARSAERYSESKKQHAQKQQALAAANKQLGAAAVKFLDEYIE
ncbi:60S ribosomal protein L16 [Tritrichomonas foetus]|uniref:60S ribosomal protein L16 n=1 Tax=Tritrichomonas foetus TaxID=1144522 RepID=A0A1J4KN48_9EUKA|nr:60S ribosomal protein L16 [Tritrichomonas foetus]OHT11220.1 60S ribosomal protein L16 [Tritrichomonas foetus]OHT11221.1 60S ribosomal protein L16 [Tritrichomonas foetus]OHT11222.1 60S ribosomal protein L16 [Tritrichomonas foetus]|eukprot:OHT11219.1 60S ribosomal protein L16 [Tritrichomonas foetus]